MIIGVVNTLRSVLLLSRRKRGGWVHYFTCKQASAAVSERLDIYLPSAAMICSASQVPQI